MTDSEHAETEAAYKKIAEAVEAVHGFQQAARRLIGSLRPGETMTAGLSADLSVLTFNLSVHSSDRGLSTVRTRVTREMSESVGDGGKIAALVLEEWDRALADRGVER